jgi:hypothetical protein
MTVTGLQNDHYLINNSINLLIDGFTSDVRYLEIFALNLQTNKTAKIRLYPINNNFKIDISRIVKSTFNAPNYPNLNINLNRFSIDFKVFFVGGTSETLTFSKYFIRGGNYQGVYPDCVTQKQNYLANGSVIGYLITKKIPVWDDQTPLSYKQILTNAYYTPNPNRPIKEILEVPCNGIKVIFLNQYGTYSEWYFNNYEIQDSTKHIDFIENFNTDFNGNRFKDLGSSVTTTINVKDSVPLRFNELIRHLIISPEIYVVEDSYNRKVILNNNKWSFNSREKMYKHSITFDYLEVLNPSDVC